MCRNCGAIYNAASGLPEKCTRCGGELYQREDDQPHTVKARMQKQKPPADMMSHYRLAGRLVDINGLQSVDKVTKQILNVLDDWKDA
jgi:adenylate kinase